MAQDHSVLLDSSTASLNDLHALAATGRLYAILDACGAPVVAARMELMAKERASSLYRGTAEEDYWAIAPYLVSVDLEFLAWIYETLWSEAWGIFVVAEAPLETLRKHFRRFLKVLDPDGEQMYFRFYDPRVLKTFLPTCSAHELQDFFGPIQVYGIPDPASRDVLLLDHRPVIGRQ